MFCIVEGDRIPCSLDGRLHIYRTEEEALKYLNESTMVYNSNYIVVPYSTNLIFGKENASSWVMSTYKIEEPVKQAEQEENPKLKSKLAKEIYSPKGLLPNGKPRKRKQRSDKGKKRA